MLKLKISLPTHKAAAALEISFNLMFILSIP